MRYTVEQFMTSHPFTTSPDDTAESAGQIMQAHGIHHLPVLREGALVGMVTERDLRLSIACSGVGRPVLVSDAMSSDPFIVGPESPVASVARLMAERRLGSTVVMYDGRVVGIH
jgi:acetoin utilization protein AcuB